MAVDPKIAEAIQNVVEDVGQSQALARRLVAWFNAVASGNEKINDRQSADRHLELLYGEVRLPDDLVHAEENASSRSSSYNDGAE